MSQPQEPQQPFNNPREARAQVSAKKAYAKAQRPWYKKKRFILPLGLLLVIIIVNSGGGDGDGTTSVSPSQPAPEAPAAPPAFPGATENDVVARAGEAVNVDGLAVTTTQLESGDDTLGETLCTTATYNNGTDEAAQFSLFDWKLQDPDGTILMTGLTGSGNLLSTGQVAPGGRTSGDVCFDAPQGSPSGQYVVLLDPSFTFSPNRVAWLNTR